MPFTVDDLRDLTRLLIERPEWLSEVRRLVLTEELLALPDIVRGLAEAQRRTEERLEQLAERMKQLAEAQRRTEERLEQLAARVDQLTERLEQLAARVDQLTERLEQLAARVDQLAARMEQLAAHVLQLDRRVERLENSSAYMRGILLEMQYRSKVPAFCGYWLRRARAMDVGLVLDELEDRLSREEIERLLPLDLLVRGQLPRQQGGEEVWLAVEVSHVIDESDVARAVERAGLLRKAGLRAVPVVAGSVLASGDVARLLEAQHVASLLDGSRLGWEEALQYASV